MVLGGKQVINIIDGYTIPLQFKDGLSYMKMSSPTDKQLEELPHVLLTADMSWNPRRLDYSHNMDDPSDWADNTNEDQYDFLKGKVDWQGYYQGHVVQET